MKRNHPPGFLFWVAIAILSALTVIGLLASCAPAVQDGPRTTQIAAATGVTK